MDMLPGRPRLAQPVRRPRAARHHRTQGPRPLCKQRRRGRRCPLSKSSWLPRGVRRASSPEECGQPCRALSAPATAAGAPKPGRGSTAERERAAHERRHLDERTIGQLRPFLMAVERDAVSIRHRAARLRPAQPVIGAREPNYGSEDWGFRNPQSARYSVARDAFDASQPAVADAVGSVTPVASAPSRYATLVPKSAGEDSPSSPRAA